MRLSSLSREIHIENLIKLKMIFKKILILVFTVTEAQICASQMINTTFLTFEMHKLEQMFTKMFKN